MTRKQFEELKAKQATDCACYFWNRGYLRKDLVDAFFNFEHLVAVIKYEFDRSDKYFNYESWDERTIGCQLFFFMKSRMYRILHEILGGNYFRRVKGKRILYKNSLKTISLYEKLQCSKTEEPIIGAFADDEQVTEFEREDKFAIRETLLEALQEYDRVYADKISRSGLTGQRLLGLLLQYDYNSCEIAKAAGTNTTTVFNNKLTLLNFIQTRLRKRFPEYVVGDAFYPKFKARKSSSKT